MSLAVSDMVANAAEVRSGVTKMVTFIQRCRQAELQLISLSNFSIAGV